MSLPNLLQYGAFLLVVTLLVKMYWLFDHTRRVARFRWGRMAVCCDKCEE